MNKIYKLKLNKQTQELMVVSELASNYIARTDSASEQGSLSNYALLSNLLDSLKAEASEAKTLRVTPVSNFIFNTTCRALGSTGAYLAGIGLLTVAGSASALTGSNVVSGDVSIAKNGSVTTITNSPSSIINWENFNIGKDEIVKFIQQSANSAVLNRVLGKQASEILGSLQSNGRVFLINPNGILFGKSATVNVAELVASTLDITNEDFTAGRYVFNQEKDTTIASVLNQGMIQVNDDGSLALIGGNVLNNGVLQARNGSIYLLAGKSITIADLDNPLISYKVSADNKAINIGSIISKNVNLLGGKVAHGVSGRVSYADIFTAANIAENKDLDIKITANGAVELYAGSVSDEYQTNQQTKAQVLGEREGLLVANAAIDASNSKGKAGSVSLLGDRIALENNSVITATGLEGGQVVVGAGVYSAKDSRKQAVVSVFGDGQVIDVSAKNDAGTITLWGDNAYYHGSLIAESQFGKGGFIETSGKGLKLADALVVATRSNLGSGYYGTWLLDPTNIFIFHETHPTDKSETSDAFESSGDPLVIKSSHSSDVYLKDTVLADKLNSTNVKLEATAEIKFLTGAVVDHTPDDKLLTLKAPTVTLETGVTVKSDKFYVEATTFSANTAKLVITSEGSGTKRTVFNVTGTASFENSVIQGMDGVPTGYLELIGGGTGRYSFTNNSHVDVIKIITHSPADTDDKSINSICFSNSVLNYTDKTDLFAKNEVNFSEHSIINQSAVPKDKGDSAFTIKVQGDNGKVTISDSTFTSLKGFDDNRLDSSGSKIHVKNADLIILGKGNDTEVSISGSDINSGAKFKILTSTQNENDKGNSGTISLIDSCISSTFTSDIKGGKIAVSGTNISYTGDFFIDIQAGKSNLDISNSNFTARGVRFVAAGEEADVSVTDSKFKLTHNKNNGYTFILNATKTATVENSNVSEASGSMLFNATSVNLNSSNFTFANTTHDVNIQLGNKTNSITDNVNLDNVTVNGGERASVDGNSKNFQLSNGTKIILADGHANFSGKESVNFTDSTVEASKVITVRGAELEFTRANLTDTNTGDTATEISIGYSNEATESVNTTSIKVVDSNFTTKGANDDVNFHATELVSITGSNGSIKSAHDINISAPTVQLAGLAANAERVINITSANIDIGTGASLTGNTISLDGAKQISLSGASISADSPVTIQAVENVSLGNGTQVKSNGDLKVNSEQANVSIIGSNLAASAGTVNITAKDNITLTRSNLSGTSALVSADTITSERSLINVSKGAIKLAAVSGMDVNHDTFLTDNNIVEFNTTNGLTHVMNSNASASEVIVEGQDVYQFNNNWTKIVLDADLNLAEPTSDGVKEGLDTPIPNTERDDGRDVDQATLLTIRSASENDNPRSTLSVTAEGEVNPTSAPTLRSGSNSNNNNNNSNRRVRRASETSNDTPAATPAVATTGISSCSVSLVDLYNKYSVSNQDRETLDLAANIKKYGISADDVREVAQGCKELDVTTLLKHVPKVAPKAK